MPTGRRDGLVSLASEVRFPGPRDSIDNQIQKFHNKSLNIKDLVALVGTLSRTDSTIMIGS